MLTFSYGDPLVSGLVPRHCATWLAASKKVFFPITTRHTSHLQMSLNELILVVGSGSESETKAEAAMVAAAARWRRCSGDCYGDAEVRTRFSRDF